MGRDTSESDSDLISFNITDQGTLNPNEKKDKQQEKAKCHKCNYTGCDKAFYRPSKLAAHIHLHNNERPYACNRPGCSKAYTNSSHLKRHVQFCHQQTETNKTYKCSEAGCNAVLKTKQFLMRHLKRVHLDFPFVCPDCPEKFKRNHQLREHSFLHTGVHPYRCETCNRGFQKQYELKRHQRSHRTYSCRLQSCNETFTTMSLYRKHLARTHKPDYRCASCDKKFSTRGNLRVHMKEKHMPSDKSWVCDVEGCGSKFAAERYLMQHQQQVHQRLHSYTCPQANCHKVFHWKKSLYHHVQRHNTTARRIRPIKKQKERKDKGQPRLCMAAELANVALPLTCHRQVIAGGTIEISDSNITA